MAKRKKVVEEQIEETTQEVKKVSVVQLKENLKATMDECIEIANEIMSQDRSTTLRLRMLTKMLNDLKSRII